MKQVKEIIKLLPKRSKLMFAIFTLARSGLGLLDLVGILMMGLLVAKTSQNLGLENQFSLLNFLNQFTLVQLSAIVLVIFISKSVFAVFFMRLMGLELANAETKVAKTLFEKILKSDFNKISNHSKQNLIYGVGGSATASITNLLTVVSTIVSESFMLIVILTTFALVNLNLTIAIFIYFLIIGYLLNKFISQMSHKAGRDSAIYGVKANQSVENSFSAFREVKTLKKENIFTENYYLPRLKFSRAAASINYIAALPRFIVEPALMVGAVLLAGFSLNSPGGLATLGIFLTGGLRIMAAMLPLQTALGMAKQLLAMAEKFIELNRDFAEDSRSESNIVDIETKKNYTVAEPIAIEISNLNFRYANNLSEVIKNINMMIPAGSLVALIGSSGSGKSTLADLLVGGISPNSGEIKFVNSRGLRLFKENLVIGYVPQEPGIISGTILENITLNPGASLVDKLALDEALTLAHLNQVIQNLSDGIDSKVGEQMGNLSGGQFQRVGLARALYARPNILVLDEATSALDMETENAIKDTLISLKKKVTTIVIAHRLSTVTSADLVFVLDQGEIVAQGTFSELSETNEIVSRFVKLSELGIN